jgi:hypothetical protein
MEKNSWYKADGKDTDSAMTRTLDNGLAQEGWDPKSPEYWEELNARVKKYLPHRTNRGTVASVGNESPKLKSVVSGSGGESGSSGNPGVFKLSGARVQALKDAGMWEDPAQRADAVKRYRIFDQQNKNGR